MLCPGHVKIYETLLLSHTLMWSEYGVHMSLLSYFIDLEFTNEILSLVVMSLCTFIVCFRISAFCSALILCFIPGYQRRGQVPGPEVQHYTHCGPKGSDGLAASSAVRKPGGVRRGPGILFSGTPLFAGLSAPHRAALHFPNVQSLPVEWMGVLLPR